MSPDEFANSVYRGLARRKLELTNVKLRVLELEQDAQQLAWVTRTAILLSYAHWEGFVKESSVKYLKLINSLNLRVDRLKFPLQAACLRSHFKRAEGGAKLSFLGSVLADIDGGRGGIFAVAPEKVVDTDSNLSSVVFKELVLALGLDYLDVYETRQAFVDTKLLRCRNQVAHGDLADFDADEASERIDGVVALLDRYADQLLDAVQDGSFCLPTS